MKTSEINTLIEELNSTVNHYVYHNDLFCGGCCFSAYALAKNLKKLGIKYRVAIFQYKDILHENVFTNAINGEGVSHVAIEVTYHHKKIVIGDCSGIYRYFNATGEKYRIKMYSGIEPEELYKGYKENEWNWRYNPYTNGAVMRDINKVAEKYMK